jgi:ribosomal protein S18 acetylase RimI-like enzyme
MIKIRRFQEPDWLIVWAIIEKVFQRRETYPFSPDITENDAHKVWIEVPTATFVAIDSNNEIVGTYYIKPNQPTLGAQICNCGYIVAEKTQRKGIASAMCQHSQKEALSLGFKSMQYNLVVSTNEKAIRLWKKHGFEIIGTLQSAFNHKTLGFVDALVMYKQLKNNH